MSPEDACARVHTALEQLPISRVPDASVPSNGLYFHYEEGEIGAHRDGKRVVRVGNHPRKQDGLRQRLQNHYSGQKNSSVFRKYLGGALLRRANTSDPCLAPALGQGHWEKQAQPSCPKCYPTEHTVSALLRERFTFRCVRIDDQQERNQLEERLIATLSACRQCLPSSAWLGKFAYNDVVQRSGMWLSRGIGSQVMIEADIKRFEALVQATSVYSGAGHFGTAAAVENEPASVD